MEMDRRCRWRRNPLWNLIMPTLGNKNTQQLVDVRLKPNGDILYDDISEADAVPLIKLEKPIYNESTHNIEPILNWFSDRVERDWEISPKTQSQVLVFLMKNCSDISQARLDNLAQSWGYDGIVSLVSYAGDLNPRFDTEGVTGKKFRSDEWSAADLFKTKCLNGEVLPTIENYLEFLPDIPERPIIP